MCVHTGALVDARGQIRRLPCTALLYVFCTGVWLCVGLRDGAQWRSEDNLKESVICFQCVISLGLTSGHPAWQQEHLCIEPSHWLFTLFETDSLNKKLIASIRRSGQHALGIILSLFPNAGISDTHLHPCFFVDAVDLNTGSNVGVAHTLSPGSSPGLT